MGGIRQEILDDRDLFTNPDDFGQKVLIRENDGTVRTDVPIVAQQEPLGVVSDDDGTVEREIGVLFVSAEYWPSPERGEGIEVETGRTNDVGADEVALYHVEKRAHQQGMWKVTARFQRLKTLSHEGYERRR